MIYYSARVVRIKGTTRHWIHADNVTHHVCRVTIEEGDPDPGVFYVFRFDEGGACIADTVSLSLEEAKRQIEYEYEVNEEQDGLPASL